MTNRGNTLISVILGFLIVGMSLQFAYAGLAADRRLLMKNRSRIGAQVLASEFLELARSMKSSEWKTFMQTAGHPACQDVNRLLRWASSPTNQVYLNAYKSPAAELEDTGFPALPVYQSVRYNPNRSFRTDVINIKTLNTVPKCGAMNVVNLGPDERFKVTVTVSWVPLGQPFGNWQEFSLSTILAE